MKEADVIRVAVPQGFPPMSLPTDPAKRFNDSDIVLEPPRNLI